ncbi:hypothetical protein D3C85_1039740 [compost metagenome]
MLVPRPPLAGVAVLLPALTPTTVAPSAPLMSLPSTARLRVVPSITEPLSGLAAGTSSTMLTSSESVAVVPLLSVTLTANDSLRLLMPLAVGWFSLSLRV